MFNIINNRIILHQKKKDLMKISGYLKFYESKIPLMC